MLAGCCEKKSGKAVKRLKSIPRMDYNKTIRGQFHMEYLTTEEAAEKWGISRRRVTVYLDEGRIKGVIRKGNIWLIPCKAEKPSDPRKKQTEK